MNFKWQRNPENGVGGRGRVPLAFSGEVRRDEEKGMEEAERAILLQLIQCYWWALCHYTVLMDEVC